MLNIKNSGSFVNPELNSFYMQITYDTVMLCIPLGIHDKCCCSLYSSVP